MCCELSDQSRDFGGRVDVAGIAQRDPFHQVNPPLTRFNACDEVLLPPHTIRQFPLIQPGRFTQRLHRGDKLAMGGGMQ